MRRILLVLVMLAALGGIALPSRAQAPPEHDGGVGRCTTDAAGMCTQDHGLGVVPTDIQVTMVRGGTSAQAEQQTSASFRVQVFNGATVQAAVDAVYWWHAWARPTPAPAPSTTTTTLPPPPAVSANLVPAKGAWWGDYVSSNPADVVPRETLSGRRFDIVHYFEDMSGTFPSSAAAALADGRWLFFNIQPRVFGGSSLCWGDVAAGAHDAWLNSEAQALASFNRPLFLSFSHEPEGNDGTACSPASGVYGTAAQFKAAWNHVHDLIEARAPKVVWVLDYANPSGAVADSFYPADSKVDWVAWDPYNWFDCRGHSDAWTQLSDKMAPFYSWARANHADKPLMLGEYGSAQPAAATPSKGAWFRSAVADLAVERPAVRAVVYFDRQDSDCAWRVDSSADATQGWQDMGTAPYFNQPHA